MNKKEIAEVKKQFKLEDCAIRRICGCYVDGDKEKKLEFKNAFLSFPEDEAQKYLDIFRKTLSGSIGKNLIDMEFKTEQEMAGGAQAFLLKLRDSRLEDDDLIEEFYGKVIDSLNYRENYYIILIHGAYDVPGQTGDGLYMDDASDDVYEFILCSICPVDLSKPCLSYNLVKNSIEDRIRDWIVNMPINGFLFPAFIDRGADIHHVLYYVKKSKEMYDGFIDEMFGTTMPMSAEMQKEAFHDIISETLGSDCDYEVVKRIHEEILDAVEEHKEDVEPLALSKNDLQDIFKKSGAADDAMAYFEKAYDDAVTSGETLIAGNLTDVKKLSIEAPDVVIKINPERTDMVETRIIEGRKCLIIPVDSRVEINGIETKIN